MQDAFNLIARLISFIWSDMWAGVHPAIIRFAAVGLLGNFVVVPVVVILARLLFGVLRGRG